MFAPLSFSQYCKLWCRLDAISSTPGTLLPLCALFEDLLSLFAPKVLEHMASLGCPALEMVFPWIRSAFCMKLEIRQVGF